MTYSARIRQTIGAQTEDYIGKLIEFHGLLSKGGETLALVARLPRRMSEQQTRALFCNLFYKFLPLSFIKGLTMSVTASSHREYSEGSEFTRLRARRAKTPPLPRPLVVFFFSGFIVAGFAALRKTGVGGVTLPACLPACSQPRKVVHHERGMYQHSCRHTPLSHSGEEGVGGRGTTAGRWHFVAASAASFDGMVLAGVRWRRRHVAGGGGRCMWCARARVCVCVCVCVCGWAQL